MKPFAALVAIGLVAQMAGVAQSPQPRFRSGVDLIEVAVLARDRSGRPVTDLTASDIEILEDGVPQRIVALQRVSLPVFRASDAKTPAAGLARDVATNEGIGESRVFILVLDALHVAPHRTISVRQFARQFIEQHVGPGDFAAVLSPGADADATEDFTRDKGRLLAAVDRFTSTKLRSATIERAEELRMAETTGIVMHGGKDPSDGERAHRVYMLTTTLEAVARDVDRIGGRRKALLLFSEGIDYDTGDVMGEAQRYASEVTHAMDRAVGALMRTNVALYTIDPRLLGSPQGDLIDTPLYSSRPGDATQLSERDIEAEQAASVHSLRHLAEATGGFLASDRGLSRAYEHIAAETSDYYMLGYTPSKPAKPGETRKLTVRISRPGVSVVARKGYVVPAPAPRRLAVEPEMDLGTPRMGGPGRPRGSVLGNVPSAPASAPSGVPSELTTLLASPLPGGGLPVRVQAVPFKGDGRKGVVQLVVEVLGGGLTFEDRGGRAEERIELALVTIDGRGRAANGRSTTIELRLPPADLQRVKSTGVRWLSKLDLAPGKYQVRIAARAARTGAFGLVTHTVDVPGFESDRLSMSGVTLTSLTSVLMPTRGKEWLEAALGTPPSAARTFVAGDQLTAAAEVYVPPSARASVEVVAQLTGPFGFNAPTIPPRAVPGASPSPRREVAFPIDTRTLPAGSYVLRVGAVAPGAAGAVEQLVPFEIVKR